MADKNLVVLFLEENSIIRIQSPAVGICSRLPKKGEYVEQGTSIGILQILNNFYNLHLPENLSGFVSSNSSVDLCFPVAYQQEIFSLTQCTDQLKKSPRHTPGKGHIAKDISSDQGFLVSAFTPGIFYARPSPEAESFVMLGQQIEKGKVLGLIEVMKTFNHIIFQGLEHSQSGIIKNILVEDGQEVKLGEALFLIDEIKK